MKYDFERTLNRTLTNDLKWLPENMRLYGITADKDSIPMWIADTDFPCAPVIVEALRKRVEHEIYGYCAPPKDFFEAIRYWMNSQYDWNVDTNWMVSVPSVVASINIAVRTFSKPGDGIIVQTPVYNPFMEVVEHSGRILRNNQLICTDGVYHIDFEDLERIASEEHTTMMILCSPHNPVGRVWTNEELERIGDICLAHGVMVVVDEIHSGIIYSGHKHYALPAVRPEFAANFIYLNSPAKSFNIAGLKISYAIIPDPEKKNAFRKTQTDLSLVVNSTFGIEALTAAYSPEGAEWLRQEVAYIEGNRDYVVQYVTEHFEGKIKLTPPEGGFLCWLDCSGLGDGPDQVQKLLTEKANVICSSGKTYGAGGEHFVRFNIGTQRQVIEKALERIKNACTDDKQEDTYG